MYLFLFQGPGIGGIQAQNGAYLPRQPHFSQPTSQQLYGQQQVTSVVVQCFNFFEFNYKIYNLMMFVLLITELP